MNLHIAIITMGHQQNIDRLMGDVFWKSVWGRVASIHLLSQGGGSVNIASPNLNYPHVKYYELAENLGCAGGRKFLTERIMKSRFCGEAFGSEDAIIFLDDDVIVCDQDWIRQLCEPLLAEYSISGVAGRRVTEDVWTEAATGDAVQYVSGGWCAIRGDVFLDGIFHCTDYFPNYWEDVHMGLECKAKGKKLIAVGYCGLEHDDNPPNRDMAAVSKAIMENRIRFAKRWGLKL
jgi:GT2 family glycosyltransferase